MTKQEARKYFKHQRSLLSEKEVENLSELIFNQWIKSGFDQFDSYHIFLPIKQNKEVNTHYILSHLWNCNKKVFCSKVKGEDLIHFELTPNTKLEINSWGIPEPEGSNSVEIDSPDCIFLPLLAYDKSGNRVGYGKGYYDKFIEQFPNSKKMGLSFFDPVSFIEDSSFFDIPLDYIITPNYFLSFGEAGAEGNPPDDGTELPIEEK